MFSIPYLHFPGFRRLFRSMIRAPLARPWRNCIRRQLSGTPAKQHKCFNACKWIELGRETTSKGFGRLSAVIIQTAEGPDLTPPGNCWHKCSLDFFRRTECCQSQSTLLPSSHFLYFNRSPQLHFSVTAKQCMTRMQQIISENSDVDKDRTRA